MAEELKVIVFTLAQEEYGIEVDKVRTIERMMPITRVPKTPAFVKGVINLRGIVIPVIDLRGRFGLAETEPTDNSRIIIVAANETGSRLYRRFRERRHGRDERRDRESAGSGRRH